MSKENSMTIHKGCVGCKKCEGGAESMVISIVNVTLTVFTIGIWCLILPFFKKCPHCGHSHFMNEHKPTDN